jgi:hypothetical protein
VRETLDLRDRDAAEGRRTFRRPLGGTLGQRV